MLTNLDCLIFQGQRQAGLVAEVSRGRGGQASGHGQEGRDEDLSLGENGRRKGEREPRADADL